MSPRRDRGRPSTVVLLGTLVLLAGCAMLNRVHFRQPTAELAAVRVTGLGLAGGTLIVGLDVTNPNPYSIQGVEIRADITLEDTHFGEAFLSGATTLPGESVTRVEIPMRFTWEGVGAAARGFLTQGSVAYVLGGRILVETPIGDQWVTLRRSGMASIFGQDLDG